MLNKIKLKFWWILHEIIDKLELAVIRLSGRVWNIYYKYSKGIYSKWVGK